MITKNFKLSSRHQLFILLILAFCLYANTLFNDYALDDITVLTGNSIVQKGISGIPQILTTGFFHGTIESDFQGGRYRPVVLVIFALEHQFFGTNPIVSHLINLVLFMFLITLLFKLLKTHIFREQHYYLAFITCLFFIVHPIHTEVVANVKSRDELITFLFLLVSGLSFIKYFEKKKYFSLAVGLFCFLLALLTRESAVPFIVIVPLILYFFYKQTIKKSILFSLPLFAVFAIYMVIRIAVVGFSNSVNSDIQNAPFLLATTTQAFATKVFILTKYLSLLVSPYPLSYDYGYNQIPYINVLSVPFFLSSLLLIGLFGYAIFTFTKRSVFSFCIFYFFITIFLFSNFLIDIGAPIAERLLFQPSLALCIVLATLFLKGFTKFKVLASSLMVAVLFLFSTKTISRNFEWKNSESLFLTDVISAPNSIRANLYASDAYAVKAGTETNGKLKNEFLNNAEAFYSFSCKLDPTGSVSKQGTNQLTNFYYNEGNKSFKTGNVEAAILNYKKSLTFNKNNVDAWYNLTKSYLKINDTSNATKAWQMKLKSENNL